MFFEWVKLPDSRKTCETVERDKIYYTLAYWTSGHPAISLRRSKKQHLTITDSSFRSFGIFGFKDDQNLYQSSLT